MDSPARKLQKQKDYQRHKMFRKMARKRKAKAEQEQKVAEKALKRKLKFPKYDDGDKPNLFKQGDRYFYQESPGSKKISVTPINTTFDNPAYWTYQDAEGRVYTPKQLPTSDPGEIKPAEQKNVLESALDNYVGELKYDLNNNVPVGGKYTMPAIAASALLPLAGEYIAGTSIAGIPTTTLMNNAIGLGFAGHGLNHLFNEGINGYGDAAMTALELSPLGKLSQPIYRTGKAFASPFVQQVINDGKWLWNEGNIIQKTIPYNPNNFYRGVGKEALKDAKESGVIRGKYFKNPYFGKAKDWWNDGVVYEGSPERIDWIDADPYHEEGRVVPFSNQFPFSAFPYENGSTIVPTKNFSYWRKYPLLGWRKNSFKNVKTPTITADNAASITPRQWTAAQDAAIARGDMAEAQRLRDLHFKVSAPNTVASVNGQPLQLYHGTDATFNAFDLSKYGSTDGGTFGRGVYTTPVKEYAELYGKNNIPLYMKLDNPRDYRNSTISDLMAEKFAFGDDFATGNGVDGAIGRPSWKGFKGLEEWISHNPKNIKSSLPVTYTDDGTRIPLGERDNFNINDIRYGLIPFGIGLTGGVVTAPLTAVSITSKKYNSGKDKIHIKPSKRGTFTAAAKRRGMGVQEFARKVLSAPKGKYSSAMRKKANFARNASKFKH